MSLSILAFEDCQVEQVNIWKNVVPDCRKDTVLTE